MARLDNQVAHAFRRMKAPELVPILEYMKGLRADHLDLLVRANDAVVLHRLQGKAEILDLLIGNIENAEKLIAKFDKP